MAPFVKNYITMLAEWYPEISSLTLILVFNTVQLPLSNFNMPVSELDAEKDGHVDRLNISRKKTTIGYKQCKTLKGKRS